MSEQNRPPEENPGGTPSWQSAPPPAYGQPPPAYGQQPPAYQQGQAPPPYAYGATGFDEPTSEERTWALIAHIGTLVSAWFAFGFIAPLITLLVKGESSPFVRRHSVESLNFQISLIIYGVVAAIVTFVVTLVTFGLALLVIVPAAIVIGLLLLVFVIIATVRASHGEEYRYPLTLRLVS